jgi:pimeloyl-ACP methyl ester carboxylesterase
MMDIDQQQFFVKTRAGKRIMVTAKIPRQQRQGKAVLLVHGSGVGWVYWDIPIRDYSIMDCLANRGLDVYAVECPGYGKSTKPEGTKVTANSVAEDLKDVVADLCRRSGVTRVSAAGHSSGGTVLLLAGTFYPELLDRMVLIGTPYRKLNPSFLEEAKNIIEAAQVHGNDYTPNLHYEDIENRLDNHEKNVLEWYKGVVKVHYPEIPAGIFPDIVENPAMDAVFSFQVPVMIFNGSEEYIMPPEDAVALFQDLGIPDKGLVIQPNGFHLPFLEKRGHLGLQESVLFWLTKK